MDAAVVALVDSVGLPRLRTTPRTTAARMTSDAAHAATSGHASRGFGGGVVVGPLCNAEVIGVSEGVRIVGSITGRGPCDGRPDTMMRVDPDARALAATIGTLVEARPERSGDIAVASCFWISSRSSLNRSRTS